MTARVGNNLADPANDLDILFPGSTAITKRLDAAWAVGSGNGGLDSGAKAASASYHVWRITRDSDGLVDALFSGSPSNPVVPPGWTPDAAPVAAIRTNSSGHIMQFLNTGNYFGLRVPCPIMGNSTVNNGAVAWPISVPTGVKVRARVRFLFQSPTQATYLGVKDPDEGVPTVEDVVGFSYAGTNADFVTEVYTNTVGQIYVYGFRPDTTVISSSLLGWRYDAL